MMCVENFEDDIAYCQPDKSDISTAVPALLVQHLATEPWKHLSFWVPEIKTYCLPELQHRRYVVIMLRSGKRPPGSERNRSPIRLIDEFWMPMLHTIGMLVLLQASRHLKLTPQGLSVSQTSTAMTMVQAGLLNGQRVSHWMLTLYVSAHRCHWRSRLRLGSLYE